MNSTAIIVVALFAAMCAFAAVAAVLGARRVAAFEAACRARGWQVGPSGHGPGQRISGSTGGVSWTYTYVQDVDRAARWRTDEVHTGLLVVESATLPGEVVLILPRRGRPGQIGGVFRSLGRLNRIGRLVFETFITRVLGGDASDVEQFDALTPAPAGGEAFRQAFTVLATSEQTAGQVVRRGEAALVAFAADPLSRHGRVPILLWRKGLVLPVERHLNRVERLEALVNLVAALASAVQAQ